MKRKTIALIGFTNSHFGLLNLIRNLNKTPFGDYIYFKIINRPDDARGVLYNDYIVYEREYSRSEMEDISRAVEIVKFNLVENQCQKK